MTEITAEAAPAKPRKPGMGDVFRALGRPKVAVMLALGFSSGLPFLLTAGTLGYWLREEGTSLKAIGFLSWVGLAYSLKFLWSPVVDRLDAPIVGKMLGRRRGWMLIAQLMVGAGLIAMATITPGGGLGPMAMAAVVVAFASATQDIVVDAWRIEAAENSEELGMLSSAYQLGYRFAIIVSDALILIIANHTSWAISYYVMAAFMAVGVFGVLRAPEPDATARPTAEAGSKRLSRREFWLYNAFLAVAGAVLVGVIELLRLLRVLLVDGFGIEGLGLKPETAHAGQLIALALLVVPLVLFGIRRCHDRGKSGWWMALFFVPVVGQIWWLIDLGLMGSAKRAERFGELPAPMPWRSVLWRTFEPGLGPLVAFFKTYGWLALLMFAFITLYRLPEFVMGPMATPFYSDLGLDKDVVGGVRLSFGLAGSILGIAVGGLLVAKLGYLRGLIVGGFFQAFAIAGFALPAIFGPHPALFAGVMMFDNFGVSIAGVALVTYMSTLTSIGYTATQYALLSSAYTFVGKIMKGFSGQMVEGLQASGHTLMQSYAIFFVGAGVIGLPAILLCLWLTVLKEKRGAAAAAA
ncbi:MFS transporter [Caulobacter sp. 17J80-11]|uniref:AmpG family muropeptide MFS transporter n=1 Tax=Caulobacter sp. 17J80-11 TaxID=2763502 RepID=UPI0016538C51|nr:MFS transporter [Caulobacter sp. 17J80-11]MBC6981475.1 MFS transporter [Caulobacter sp. 17J80-11]